MVHLSGQAYGLRAPDASLLGCSFDEVKERQARRGVHRIPYLSDIGAPLIVEAFLDAIYRSSERTDYFGLSCSTFSDDIHANNVQWAPDGDEAFDDGSYVLQFDVEDRVRLVAFRHVDCSEDAARSISEVWIASELFYGVLSNWSELFEREWCDRLRAKEGVPH